MKAAFRLMIAAAVLMSAQMSFASSDTGATKPGCPYAHVPGTLSKTNFEPRPATTQPSAPSNGSAS